jgi:hypothetical protein
MELKHKGWFAAGVEMLRAMNILSDGAFKVFFFVCLHADRNTGVLAIGYRALATSLEKSRGPIVKHMQEIEQKGVCIVEPAPNQYGCTKITVCDDYWPYTRPTPHESSMSLKRLGHSWTA